MTEHPQVHIEWDGHEADVDEDIADLILACWKAGIPTLVSCQDFDPKAAVRRAQVGLWADGAERFLTLIAEPHDELSISAVGGVIGGPPRDESGWSYSFTIRDLATVQEPDADVCIMVFVVFPFADVDEVIRRLARHHGDQG